MHVFTAESVINCSKIRLGTELNYFSDKLTLINMVPGRIVASPGVGGQNTIITIYFTLYIYIGGAIIYIQYSAFDNSTLYPFNGH